MNLSIWFLMSAIGAAGEPSAASALPSDAPHADGHGAATYTPDFFSASRPGDAMDMINRIPGFAFDGGANVRGLSGAAGNVLIDGRRPASKSDGLSDILGRVPASQILRIDVIRGGASGIDMQRKSVVANVVRDPRGGVFGSVTLADRAVPEADRNQGSIAADISARLGAKVLEASIAYADGEAGERAFTDRRRVDRFGDPLIVSRGRPDRHNREATGTALFEAPLGRGDVRLNTRAYRDRSGGAETDDLSLPSGLAVTLDEYQGQGGEFGGGYAAPLGGGFELETVGLKQWRENQSISSSADAGGVSGFHKRDESGETVGRGVLRFRRSPTMTFEAGLEAAYNWLEGDSALVIDGAPTPVPGAQARVEERRGEGFATGIWQAQPALMFEVALRVEASTLTTSQAIEKQLRFAKPSAAMTWSPTPQRQIRLRLEREAGQLNFGDFLASASLNTGVVTAGAGDLTPTQTWRAELAFEQQFWESGALVAVVRREQLADVIDRVPVFDPSGIFDAKGNIGAGVRHVFEVNSTLPLDWGGIAGGLFKTWIKAVHSKVTDPTTGDRREISGQAAFEWNARFTQDLPNWNATWGVSASGASERATYRFNGRESWGAQPYTSAFVDYTPRPDMTLRLELNNLSRRGAWNVRETYSGLRHMTNLAYLERREDDTYQSVRISLRKSFD